MKKSALNVLRQRTERIILDNISPNYRCHDYARIIREDLSELGYNDVEVRDGVVRYNPKEIATYAAGNFDIEFCAEFLRKNDEEELAKDIEQDPYLLINEFRRMAENFPEGIERGFDQAHSWLEGDDVIVDYNPTIPLPGTKIPNVLVVEPKEDLEDLCSYDPNGREVELFGRSFLRIPGSRFHGIPRLGTLIRLHYPT